MARIRAAVVFKRVESHLSFHVIFLLPNLLLNMFSIAFGLCYL